MFLKSKLFGSLQKRKILDDLKRQQSIIQEIRELAARQKAALDGEEGWFECTVIKEGKEQHATRTFSHAPHVDLVD